MPEDLAANTTEPIITMHERAFMAMIIAPLKAEEPNGEEVELAQAFATSAPSAALTRHRYAAASGRPKSDCCRWEPPQGIDLPRRGRSNQATTRTWTF